MLDRNYSELIINAIAQEPRKTRNATARSYFGAHLIVDDLRTNHFPLLLGRKLFYNGILGEFAAFIRGPQSVKDFEIQGCNYWKGWASAKGKLVLDYGNAWIDFNGVNQLKELVNGLKKDPMGRRHIISSWRPDRLKDLSLPCCHYAYQWYVTDKKELEMIWIQRSVDTMVGLPSDIVLAAVWNILLAQTVGLKPGRLNFMLGDVHVYESHLIEVETYLKQMQNAHLMPKPTWNLDEKATVFNFVPNMLEIIDYKPQPAIKFKLEI